jgi:hypothetical protein
VKFRPRHPSTNLRSYAHTCFHCPFHCCGFLRFVVSSKISIIQSSIIRKYCPCLHMYLQIDWLPQKSSDVVAWSPMAFDRVVFDHTCLYTALCKSQLSIPSPWVSRTKTYTYRKTHLPYWIRSWRSSSMYFRNFGNTTARLINSWAGLAPHMNHRESLKSVA